MVLTRLVEQATVIQYSGRSARNCSRCSGSRWQMIPALSCRGRSNSFSSAPVYGANGSRRSMPSAVRPTSTLTVSSRCVTG